MQVTSWTITLLLQHLRRLNPKTGVDLQVNTANEFGNSLGSLFVKIFCNFYHLNSLMWTWNIEVVYYNILLWTSFTICKLPTCLLLTFEATLPLLSPFYSKSITRISQKPHGYKPAVFLYELSSLKYVFHHFRKISFLNSFNQ